MVDPRHWEEIYDGTDPDRLSWHQRRPVVSLELIDLPTPTALAAATVAPGGHLVLGTFAADGPDHCSGLPVARYRPDLLAARFAPDFAPVTDRRERHRTPAGVEQPFTWLVLRRDPSPRPEMAENAEGADRDRIEDGLDAPRRVRGAASSPREPSA